MKFPHISFRKLAISSILAVGLISTTAIAQTNAAEPALLTPSTDTASSSFGTRWNQGNGYMTELTLTNDGISSESATVTLLSASGKSVGSTQVQVPANGSTSSAFAPLVSTTTSDTGGVVVQWSTPATAVSGVIQITSPTGSVAAYPVQGGYLYDTDQKLAAPYWLPDSGSDGSLVLFNTSASALSVSPLIAVSGVVKTLPAITLAPNATQEVSLRSLLTQAGTDAQSGSVTLQYAGQPHALQPSLLLSNEHTGFSLVPTFSAAHKRASSEQTTWQFPYVATESGDQTSASNLTAYALLSNQTTTQQTPELEAYMVSRRRINQQTLTVPTLGPNETRLVNVSQLLPTTDTPQVALTLRHQGQPGDIGVTIFTVNSTNQVVSSSQGILLASQASAISYWDVSNDKLLLHQLKSANDSQASTGATLYYQKVLDVGEYTLPTTFTAGDTPQTVNLSTILHAGALDDTGRRMPTGVNSGLVVLSSPPSGSSPQQLASMQAICSTTCKTESVAAALPQTSALVFSPGNGMAPMCTGPISASCFAQLKYRSVIVLGVNTGKNHSFWWIQDSGNTQYVIDAGPSGSCPQSCGYLVDWVVAGTVGHYTADNSGDALAYASATSSSVCTQVNALEAYARAWPQTTYQYAMGAAPNSNTFAHDCANAGTFPASAPPNAPGW